MTAQAATSTLSPSDLDYFVRFVNDKIGVQLADKAYLVESRLQPLVRSFGVRDLGELMQRLRAGDPKIQAEALDAITTNETSFFRDHHPFETLATEVLPSLLTKTGGTLTIWNGACSSGQESYTLAITLHEHFPSLCSGGKVKIISTDVSSEMVQRTKDGIYSRFEINRGLPSPFAVKYFDQQGRKWVAKPSLRQMIDVRTLNLLGPWQGLPRADLVLLRNVLIYFTPQVKQDILRRIRTQVLAPHGSLLLGASESTIGLDPGYHPKRVGDSTIYSLEA